MRILIVEDDQASSLVLTKFLEHVGEIQTAFDGEEGLNSFRTALVEGRPFKLVCLDIMMPRRDGQSTLKEIRSLESQHGVAKADEVKVIMTTSLGDKDNLVESIPRCDAYLTKPIDRTQLMFYVRKFGLMSPEEAQKNAEREEKRREARPWDHKDKDLPWVG
jgi:two-component system chemotaxis response regulator CheY